MTILKPGEMANKLGISVKTLQRWDDKGILKAHRSPTNRRFYDIQQYYHCLGIDKQIKNTTYEKPKFITTLIIDLVIAMGFYVI